MALRGSIAKFGQGFFLALDCRFVHFGQHFFDNTIVGRALCSADAVNDFAPAGGLRRDLAAILIIAFQLADAIGKLELQFWITGQGLGIGHVDFGKLLQDFALNLGDAGFEQHLAVLFAHGMGGVLHPFRELA